jgi:hypothetical protein
MFGKEDRPATLEEFRRFYAADPLYQWIGLDSDLMYAAHKAAGGMTSVYRQLGVGCERLLREVTKDQLGLDDEEVRWSYKYENERRKAAVRHLDVKIEVAQIKDRQAQGRVSRWLLRTADFLELTPRRAKELRGAVFEVRQGYKSADSKRQVADLTFGSAANSDDFLPVVAIVSKQVSETVIRRYRAGKMLVLLGTLDEHDTQSTFAFMREVVGYDLAAFFKRNSSRSRREVTKILKGLLSPS